jgi:serine protease AprX
MPTILFRLALLLSLLTPSWTLPAQSLYLVQFDQKPAAPFTPETYFDAHALQRRARLGLPAWDWYDRPVDGSYVQAVSQRVTQSRHVLRWFNGVSVRATEAEIAAVAQLPFVQHIERLGQWEGRLAAAPPPPDGFDALLTIHRSLLELDTLAAAGLNGEGVRIAIFDAGFKEADTHPALAEVRVQGRILRCYDFFGRDSNVYHHDRHGTEVMSCIAGQYEGRNIGAAPQAEFLLARVEHGWREPAREEDHWLAAAEWADRHGADLINSSLGYTSKRYQYSDMDGKTALVSRAAQIATAKGMLVINSAGNEGADKWTYIGAPADVPEVLTVGGSLPMLEHRIKFSSIGPNSEGVIKPDVAAPGYVLSAWKRDRYRENAGTSFAAPLVTGMVACVLQMDSSLGPLALADRMRRAGHYYPYYDYELGYGVVKGSRLTGDTLELIFPSFDARARGDSIILAFSPYVLGDTVTFPHGRMLYYHLENPQGQLEASEQIAIPHKARFYYFRRRPEAEGLLRIWFAGYYFETELEPLPEPEPQPNGGS